MKENFSPEYPGAVSIFINDTLNHSKYKSSTTVFGSTEYKKTFKHKYVNLKPKYYLLQSQNRKYVEEFKKHEIKNNSDLIEIHNRPNYVNYIENLNSNTLLILYFHNDPLTMNGSKFVYQRKNLLKRCSKIIFNSDWSKNRFLKDLKNISNYRNKICTINQSTKKNKINFLDKKKIITFVGKLNKNKGYDLFGEAIIKILNKHKDWIAYVAGDEPRDKLIYKHKKLKILGFQPHKKIIDLLKKTSISVVCSRWDEPFGRVSLEASANGCAAVISNRGGLPETNQHAIVLNKLDSITLYKKIDLLIKNKSLRINLQKKSYRDFYLTNKYVSKLIDNIRKEKLSPNLNLKKNVDKLKILHVTNFNERFNGRLFFNTGKRINNGFIRLGHSVLGFSDRDIQKYYKSFQDFKGAKTLNDKLKKTCYNYKPDMIILGHADLISPEQINELKNDYPNVRIGQWFLDPLNKKGPDFERNKDRILDKINSVDATFLTTSPSALNFIPKDKCFYIPNPSDKSFETLNNFHKSCNVDVFFALSHGVHRGVLKTGKTDDRVSFVNKLIDMTSNAKFDVYGVNNIQPIWADHYFKTIENAKMGLNLSRGDAIKYYSSDRITQIVGNGLVCLIDEKTQYRDFFNDKEMVFYKNINDLSEKILKISNDEKLRKMLGRNGKYKYMKYFNSTLVAEFIINKTLGINNKKTFFWNN